MYQNKMKMRAYFKKYVRNRQLRWHLIGCCIDCGLPCEKNPQTKKPYWRCKKHRIRTSKSNKRYYANRQAIQVANSNSN